MQTVDLNCDLGEGAGDDVALLAYVTSANIACGFHAGGPALMRDSVAAAQAAGVAIGAHPGLPDRENFGRREMAVTPSEVYAMVAYQVGALAAFVRAEKGATLRHVKPHGALYNMAAVDASLADAIVAAVRDVDSSLLLMGLSGSELMRAGQRGGIATASEVFADRTYRRDGTLTPRTSPGALVSDTAAAVAQSVGLVRDGAVQAIDGSRVVVRADTICLHGDGSHALEFARSIRAGFAAAGIAVAAIRRS